MPLADTVILAQPPTLLHHLKLHLRFISSDLLCTQAIKYKNKWKLVGHLRFTHQQSKKLVCQQVCPGSYKISTCPWNPLVNQKPPVSSLGHQLISLHSGCAPRLLLQGGTSGLSVQKGCLQYLEMPLADTIILDLHTNLIAPPQIISEVYKLSSLSPGVSGWAFGQSLPGHAAQHDSLMHPPPWEAQTCRANLQPAVEARCIHWWRQMPCPRTGALFLSLSPCRRIFLRNIFSSVRERHHQRPQHRPTGRGQHSPGSALHSLVLPSFPSHLPKPLVHYNYSLACARHNSLATL